MLVTKTGGSMRVTLPNSWCKVNNIQHGSVLQVMEHGMLIVFPLEIDEKMNIDKMLIDIKGAMTFLKG